VFKGLNYKLIAYPYNVTKEYKDIGLLYLRCTKIQHEQHLSPSNRKLQKIFSQATLFFDILPNHLINVRCAFPQAILPHVKVPEASGESVAASSHIVINDWRELRITALKYLPRAETSQQKR